MEKPLRQKHTVTIPCDMLVLGQALVVVWVAAHDFCAPILSALKMYTANTMASAAEALGMTLPGSSSFPAESAEKIEECKTVGVAMRNLIEKNILPRDMMTRAAFENAMVRLYRSHVVMIQSRGNLLKVDFGHDSRRFYQCCVALDCDSAFRRYHVDY